MLRTIAQSCLLLIAQTIKTDRLSYLRAAITGGGEDGVALTATYREAGYGFAHMQP